MLTSDIHYDVHSVACNGAGNLKLTFPIAVAATQIAWAMIAAPGAFASTPSTKAHLASLKWGTDYLMACRPSPTQFVAQVRPSYTTAREATQLTGFRKSRNL